jgi:hypothetical protein
MTTAAQINPYPDIAPHVVVERHLLPPIPAAGAQEFTQTDTYATATATYATATATYATATAGEIRAEVQRFVYWDPRDKEPDVDVTFEARIDGGGLPDTCGFGKICAFDAETMYRLAAVCEAAGTLLDEVIR